MNLVNSQKNEQMTGLNAFVIYCQNEICSFIDNFNSISQDLITITINENQNNIENILAFINKNQKFIESIDINLKKKLLKVKNLFSNQHDYMKKIRNNIDYLVKFENIFHKFEFKLVSLNNIKFNLTNIDKAFFTLLNHFQEIVEEYEQAVRSIKTKFDLEPLLDIEQIMEIISKLNISFSEAFKQKVEKFDPEFENLINLIYQDRSQINHINLLFEIEFLHLECDSAINNINTAKNLMIIHEQYTLELERRSKLNLAFKEKIIEDNRIRNEFIESLKSLDIPKNWFTFINEQLDSNINSYSELDDSLAWSLIGKSINSSISNNKTISNIEIDKLKNEIQELDQQLQNTKQREVELIKKLDLLSSNEVENNQLLNLINEKDKYIQLKEDEIINLKINEQNLLHKLDLNKDYITSNELKLKELFDQNKEIENKLLDKIKEFDNLKEQENKLRQELDNNKTQYIELKIEFEKESKLNEEKLIQYKEIEKSNIDKLKNLQEQLKILNEKLENSKTIEKKLKEKDKEIEKLNTIINDLKENESKLNKVFESTKTIAKNLQNEINTLENNQKEQISEIIKLNNQNEKFNSIKIEYETKINDYETKFNNISNTMNIINDYSDNIKKLYDETIISIDELKQDCNNPNDLLFNLCIQLDKLINHLIDYANFMSYLSNLSNLNGKMNEATTCFNNTIDNMIDILSNIKFTAQDITNQNSISSPSLQNSNLGPTPTIPTIPIIPTIPTIPTISSLSNSNNSLYNSSLDLIKTVSYPQSPPAYSNTEVYNAYLPYSLSSSQFSNPFSQTNPQIEQYNGSCVIFNKEGKHFVFRDNNIKIYLHSEDQKSFENDFPDRHEFEAQIILVENENNQYVARVCFF